MITGVNIALMCVGAFSDDLEVNQVVAWSDSTTVLKWINSDVVHHKYFVAHRVKMITKIQSYCGNISYRYCPLELNPVAISS